MHELKMKFTGTLFSSTFFSFILFMGLTSVSSAQQDELVPKDKPKLSASHDGFNIQLAAIKPDSIRAFFTGRGFPQDMVNTIAAYCVISTKIENTGNQAFSYNLKKWEYETTNGKRHKLKIKDDWIKEWRQQGIKFAFSQLAANPTFLPGDWISSMTTYKIPHGSVFNLHYQWNINGKDNTGIINGVKCADGQ